MTSVLTAVCPECQVIYRIDPSRVPPGGLRARCTACGAVIAIGLSMPPFIGDRTGRSGRAGRLGCRGGARWVGYVGLGRDGADHGCGLGSADVGG